MIQVGSTSARQAIPMIGLWTFFEGSECRSIEASPASSPPRTIKTTHKGKPWKGPLQFEDPTGACCVDQLRGFFHPDSRTCHWCPNCCFCVTVHYQAAILLAVCIRVSQILDCASKNWFWKDIVANDFQDLGQHGLLRQPALSKSSQLPSAIVIFQW